MTQSQTIRLGDLCDVRIGRTPRRDTPRFWNNGSHPWVTIGEMNGGPITTTKEGITDAAVAEAMPAPVEIGTILFSFKLSIGKTAIAGRPLWTNEAIAALPIRRPDILDRDYLRAVLAAGRWEAGANHAVLGRVLNKEKLLNLPISVPPLPEQRRIVDILDRAASIRALRRQAQDTARLIIPALFNKMFGDPATNPMGWPIVSIGDLTSYTRYGPRFHDRAYSDNGAHILRTTDMGHDGSLRWWNAPLMSVNNTELDRYALRHNTLLITRTGATIGKTVLFKGATRPCIAGAYLIEVGIASKACPDYVLHFLLSSYGQKLLVSGARAVAQPNINVPAITAIRLPLPPLAVQREFSEKAAQAHRLIMLLGKSATMDETTAASIQARVLG